MFPRIKSFNKNNTVYKYLVISESIHQKGKGSTTKDIAKIGNINKFKTKDINSLIDGLIRIFNVEKYSLTDDIKFIESLEHGSIILWKKIWDELNLSKTIQQHIKNKNKRIKIEVEKYVEMMTINRCVDPLSKLGVVRWHERTCFKAMHGYSQLPLEVNYFYRSMDQLLQIKDELELSIYEKLRNLFSVNVKMTFYDITSTFFYGEHCPIAANGYSRDSRPDKKQIVVGVVTSYEGYPLSHYVFSGNTKDEKTVQEVITELKKKYNIEETTFVGDRGMITKLNLNMIIDKGYDYIMGVKGRQDAICEMLFSEEEIEQEYPEQYKGLKIKEKKVKVKEYLIWKCRKILSTSNKGSCENKYSLLENKITSLTNKDDPKYREYKTVLQQIIPEIESKLCQKLFRIIQQYIGKYEDEFRYIICLNSEKKKKVQDTRDKYILKISNELDKLLSEENKNEGLIKKEKSINKVFEGYKSKYRKYFEIEREEKNQRAKGYKINQDEIKQAEKMDGIFILLTSRDDIPNVKVVESYKNLKEIEVLFDDFKNFVDTRPLRHRLEVRVRAHVFICILALLLKRIFEINYMGGKAITEVLEEISKSKLIQYEIRFSEKEVRRKIFWKITNTNPTQKKYFNMVGIKHPMSLEQFI